MSIKTTVRRSSPSHYVTFLDSPRLSRMDRNSRSVSQPRGKRDSSVSSAYGGGTFYWHFFTAQLNDAIDHLNVTIFLAIFAQKRTFVTGV